VGETIGEAQDGPRVHTRYVMSRGVAAVHIWLEVLLDDQWWPLDFIGADHGRRVMTPQNVRTPSVRRRIHDWTPMLDAYCFGTVDPYRLYLAEPPKGLIGLPIGEGVRDLAALRRARWATRHVLSVAIDGAPAMHPW
jgi:hypothetical protein